MAAYALRVVGSILSIDRAAWNACPASSCPFLSWDFHALLEASGAVGASADPGPVAELWTPAHAAISKGGRDVAYLPLYVIAGSPGSFVWDDGMEAAARSVGRRWYPKLAGAVPFTPAPVWRPLVAPGEDEAETIAASLKALSELARSGGFSGVHLHWTDPIVGSTLGGIFAPGAGRPPGGGPPRTTGAALRTTRAAPWAAWRRQVYRWENRGYRTFDEFTGSFSKNMRRNVGRDRADVREAGVSVKMVRGDGAGADTWRLMAALYARTNDRFGPWAARFLPDAFFELAPDYIGASTVFSAAYDEGSAEPIALALLFRDSSTLWGRYWGAARDIRGLHFEACYYAPIEYAIREGLAAFDPGMGGDHKARRGFKSALASSWHMVFDTRLRRAYAQAIAEASEAEERFAAMLDEELPFKKAQGPRP